MYYQKFKRDAKVSRCNLCLEEKLLSWDHVPPKGGIDLSVVEQETVLQNLTVPEENKKYSLSQNGVKYRTVCKECNEILGSDFDVELNNFALCVKDFLSLVTVLPDVKLFKIKPNKIIKSIFGHLLVAKVGLENTKVDKGLRAYYFDKIQKTENKFRIFYWFYPYQNFVVIRDICMTAIRGKLGDYGIFSILKYYPIAYLVTDLENYSNLNEFTEYASENIEDEKDVLIHFNRIKYPDWPERVDQNNIVFGGQSVSSSVVASPRKF